MKRKLYLLLIVFFVAFTATSAVANTANAPKRELTAEQQARLDQIIRRVEEIKSMDKSDLTRTERKQLKKELVELKKEAKVMSGGVYLSVGAIIIIILLLILIL